MNILLIEDNPGDARLIEAAIRDSETLSDASFRWERTLEEGLASFRDQEADTILLDLHLPDAREAESVHRVTAAAPDTPVVVLTGADDQQLARKTLRGGAQDYLTKDRMDPDDLERSVRYSGERKERERRLRQEERYRTLFEGWPDGVLLLDEEGRIRSANEQIRDIFGYPPDVLEGEPMARLLREDDWSLTERSRHGQTPNKETRPVGGGGELTGRTRDGGTVPVELALSTIELRDGARVIATVRDLSEKRELEEKAKVWHRAMQNSVTAVALGDQDGQLTSVNPALLETWGYDRNELIGRNGGVLWEDGERANEIVDRLMAGERWQGELTAVRADGSRFPALVSASPVEGKQGEAVAVIGTFLDISHRKEAERARSRLTAILESTPDYVATADTEGRIQWVNRPGQEMLGVSEGQSLVGTDLRETHPDWARRKVLEEGLPTAREQGVWEGETALLTCEGEEIPVSQIILAHRAEDGSVEYYSTIARNISEAKRRERQLQKSERRLRRAEQIAQVGHWVWDVETDELEWSDETYRIFGYEPESVDPDYDLFMQGVPSEDREALERGLRRALDGNEPFDVIHRFSRPDGTVRWLRERGEVVRDEEGTPLRMIGVAHDITERKREEAKRRRSEKRYRNLFQESQDAVYVTGVDGTIEEINEAGCDLLGLSGDDLNSRRATEYYADPSRREELLQVVERQATVKDFPVDLKTVNGDIRHCRITASARCDASGEITGVRGIIRDVTEQTQMREKLEQRALYDQLTGVANRALWRDRLEYSLAISRRQDENVGILFVDLDRFKKVNDDLGHAVGDEVLQEIARRLEATVREEDSVARIGGDEFTVLLEENPSTADARIVAHRIAEALDVPIEAGNRDFYQTASIGIVVESARDVEPDELVRRADQAMYQAKDTGTTEFRVHAPDVPVQSGQELAREHELREGIERNQFELFYQPVHDLTSGDRVTLEALARWPAREDELRSPGEFIPLAEETGLIVPLGERLLETAYQDIQRIQRNADPLSVAVNISSQQFAAGEVVEQLREAISRGLDADCLDIEVTERLLFESQGVVDELRDLGVGVVVDDFGTGYSSLQYLRDLDITGVKIDRSFVSKLGESPVDEAIIEAVTTLGQSLDLSLVAEGIETDEQRRRARELGCQFGQGFLFSRPSPLSKWFPASDAEVSA